MKTVVVYDSEGAQRCWASYEEGDDKGLAYRLAEQVWEYAQSRPDLAFGKTVIEEET